VIANVGLTQLIAISLPVLLAIYPVAIVLVILSFFDRVFYRKPFVYMIALSVTAVVSIFDALRSAGIALEQVDAILSHLLFFDQGICWVVPAFVGTVIGIVIARMTHKNI